MLASRSPSPAALSPALLRPSNRITRSSVQKECLVGQDQRGGGAQQVQSYRLDGF